MVEQGKNPPQDIQNIQNAKRHVTLGEIKAGADCSFLTTLLVSFPETRPLTIIPAAVGIGLVTVFERNRKKLKHELREAISFKAESEST